jgi:alkanesulfonate monooxygenase SsuD/methylene tetrahydromethanopterin reductase-like flavin-dependent oxidoreductase (luciferase family)
MVNLYECTAYEIDPNDAQERFEEIETIMLDCWTKERVVHNGKYWSFDIPHLRPRPFTSPHPQILRAVTSEASIKALAKLGIGGVALRLRVGPMPVAFSMKALRLFMQEIAPAVADGR